MSAAAGKTTARPNVNISRNLLKPPRKPLLFNFIFDL
jgi:hypothetical protein